MKTAKETPDKLEIIPEVALPPGKPVLINWMVDTFSKSGLDEVLKANCAETLVLPSYVTHAAVYTAYL